MLDRVELRRLLANASATIEFQKRMNDPKTGTDFLLAAGISGSNTQKKITQLKLAILDEEDFIIAVLQLSAQIARVKSEREQEDQLLKAYLRREEDRYDRIEAQIQQERQVQIQRFEAELQGKPLAYIQETQEELSVQLTTAVKELEEAKQAFAAAAAEFVEATDEVDEVRAEIFESALQELDLDEDELESVLTAQAHAPSTADQARATDGNLKTVITATTDALRPIFALMGRGPINPAAIHKHKAKIEAFTKALDPENQDKLEEPTQHVNSSYNKLDDTADTVIEKENNVEELKQKLEIAKNRIENSFKNRLGIDGGS